MNLSQSSINQVIKEIEVYKNSLATKTDQFLQELAKVGIREIEDSMSKVVGDSNPNHYAFVKINSFGNYSKATLVLQGRDVAFIEFGAGIHYNTAVGTSPNPLGQKMGFTIGSYGKGLGANDSWVYYSEEYGRFLKSLGTKAAMPMYNAEVEMRNKFLSVAKKVFGE